MSGFAEVLTELMVVNEVSEAALAKAINVDISQIYKYKRGKYNPALVKAVQIADFFDCSMDFLFGLTDVQRSGSGFKKHGNFAEIFRKALLQTERRLLSYTYTCQYKCFFRGIYDSNLYAALFDVIEPDLRASSVGIMTAFAFLVGALAPLVLGFLKADYGLAFGISFLSVFYLFGALAIFVAIKFFFLKEFYEEK